MNQAISARRLAVVVVSLAAATTFAARGAGAQRTAIDRSPLERKSDSLIAAGKYQDALPLLSQLTRTDSTAPRHWFALGMAAAGLKDYARGVTAFARASTLGAGPAAAYNAGAMHARLGHTDSAFTWLNQAIVTGFADMQTLNTDDDLATIRSDARFAQLRYAMTHAPVPCLADSMYRKFDFWVGKWAVTTPGGQVTGSSHVDVVSGGCALLENWTSARGAEGKSLNTYNPITGTWQQYWVGQVGGATEYRESEWRGRSLSFLARYAATQQSPATLIRLTFTPLNDSTVRQHGERSSDDGKTWATTYDFHYHRRQ